MISCRRVVTLALASATAHLSAHALKGDDVYESVSSKVSSLAAQLSEMELANKQAMAKKKAQYEEGLADEKKKNAAIEVSNVKLEQEIDALAKGNAEKRKKAEGLKKDISNLQADFSFMNSNFSTSLEFADMTMQDLGRGLQSKDLKVLAEIEKKAEEANSEEERAARLERIASVGRLRKTGGLALLQTQGAENPHSFLSALDGDLQDLGEQHRKELAELKATYGSAIKDLKDKGDLLSQKNAALVQEKLRLSKLSVRLQEAVKFLEKVNDGMESKARSLRMFASRIGIRPVPHTHRLPTELEPAEEASD